MSWLSKFTGWFEDTASGFKTKPFSKDISSFPACSIMSVRGNDSALGTAIRISEKDREGGDDWPNHSALYMGSGCHEVLEATAKGFQKTKIEDSMDNRTQIKLFVKTNMTVAEMTAVKDKAYSMVGKTGYDFLGLLSFWIPAIVKPSKTRGWCSEDEAHAFLGGNIKISNKPPEQTAPADIETYLTSVDGVAAGWVLWDSYNC